jgi:formylglycine-generating enzyme required for sulfatase activity
MATMIPSPDDGLRLMVGRTACEFVYIPAGVFLMGTDAERASSVAAEFPGVQVEWILKEVPVHEVYLPDYYISRTPVTNQLWAEYNQRTDSPPPMGWEHSPANSKHPVTGITYEEAQAFCRWLSQVSGYRLGLPSEAQWEKAARGTDAREWP